MWSSWNKSLFPKLDSTKGCRGFCDENASWQRVLFLAFLNLYVRVKIHVETFDSNYFVTDSMQTIAAAIQKLPDSVV
jgi:hypothetical protein